MDWLANNWPVLVLLFIGIFAVVGAMSDPMNRKDNPNGYDPEEWPGL